MSDKKYTASQWAKIYGGHEIDDDNDNSLQLVHELTESRLFRNKKIASEVNLDDAAEISFMYLMLLNIFNKDYDLIQPSQNLQKKSVNKAIKLVKMGNVKAAAKTIQPAINELIKMKCKKIILGCTELPIAIFAFKSFNNVRSSKIFLDPNLILANSAMAKHKR